MPISVIQNPATFSPTSEAIWSIVNSATSSSDNFKYIYNYYSVNQTTGVTTSLGEYPYPPLPVTGYGRGSSNEVLNTQLSYDFQPFIATASKAENSIVKYYMNWGYQNNPNIDFVDIVLYILPNAWLGINTSVTGPWNIQAGDIINIELDNLTVNPQYSGSSTVVSVTTILGFQYIEINKAYVAPPPSVAQPGTINLLKRTIDGTSSVFYGYNGTRQYDEINTNFSNTHAAYFNTQLMKPLTTYKVGLTSSAQIYNNTKKIFPNQYETLSFLWGDINANYNLVFKTYDSSYTAIGTYSYTIPTSVQQYHRFDIPIGTTGSGYIPSWTNVKYYSVDVNSLTGTFPFINVFNKMRKYYEIESGCSIFNNFRLAFLNRHGGFDYWNFNYKSTNTTNITRNEYKRSLDYNYSVGDRQYTTLSVRAYEQYTITSDYMGEDDYRFLKELSYSKDVFLVDDISGVFYPINILNNTWVIDFDPDRQLGFAQVDFKNAYDISIQRG